MCKIRACYWPALPDSDLCRRHRFEASCGSRQAALPAGRARLSPSRVQRVIPPKAETSLEGFARRLRERKAGRA
jgi:hypothetical protein